MKKILVSSDCHARFDLLLPKVQQLHKKNSFDMMLMVGDIFSLESAPLMKEIMNKTLSIPLPIYFIDSSKVGSTLGCLHPNGTEIAPNFFFLGQHGYVSVKGIKIAFLNGVYGRHIDPSIEYKGKYFTSSEVDSLIRQCQEVDILLTNQWPQEFNPEIDASRNSEISRLCQALCPHYHIGASGKSFFRMKPFKNAKGEPTHFLNIAQVQKQLPKDKYLFAIQVDPAKKQNIEMMESPFQAQEPTTKAIIKRYEKKEEKVDRLDKNSFIYFEGFPHYTRQSQITEFLERWGDIENIEISNKLINNTQNGLVKFREVEIARICAGDSGRYSLYGQRIKFQVKSLGNRYRKQQCYLCENSPNFDKSLVLHRGQLCYIAMDKGPIIPNHMQVIPFNHIGSTVKLSPPEQEQIQSYINKLISYAEQNKKTILHYQRHMRVSEQIDHCVIHCLLIDEGEKAILEKFQLINISNRLNFSPQKQPPKDYFISLAINHQRFLKPLRPKDKDFDTIRHAVCDLMDRVESYNWRGCQPTPKERQQTGRNIGIILKEAHIGQ